MDENKDTIKSDTGKKYDGWVSSIQLNGKIYGIKAAIVEVHEMKCPNCGSPLKIEHGDGQCKYCGSIFTTKLVMVQSDNN